MVGGGAAVVDDVLVGELVLGTGVLPWHSVHWHLFSYWAICRHRSSGWSLHSGVFCPGAGEQRSTQGGGAVVGNGPVEPMSVEPISPMAALAKVT